MLSNACFLAKIGVDTAENEQHFAEFLPKTGNYPTGPVPIGIDAAADQDAHGVASKGRLEANDFSVPGCCVWALNEESGQSKKEGRGMPPATANLDLYCSLVASNFGIASSYERKNSV